MITSLLIANRGEIACRIIRTARAMGIRTVAVYSDADAKALHVRQADEAVHIGPSPARESYLVGEKIIAAAKQAGAEAIHPGYGFLSENAAFAQSVIDAGLIWVGPRPASITAMGLKDAAKKLMAEAGVPVTPGYMGESQEAVFLADQANQIGYPVLIKAVAGGGGKGMRKVDAAADFADAVASCQREAAAAFGNDHVLIEKYIQRPRHIEVQVFGDTHGNIVHLFERDCSLQRRHQKVIEEAPAPGMDAATRAILCDTAVRAARAVDYVGAGTIEFIADASDGLSADRIWFMEMNTRLQVEHPVTEEITGVDLVEWQLRVASGEPLPLKQEELKINGWAMEARLYAEDPAKGFLPSTGRVEHFELPGVDVRVDTGVEQGGEVSSFYDPMIAKIIVHDVSRDDATEALGRACREVVCHPVATNARFLARLLDDEDFAAGRVSTGLIESRLEPLTAAPTISQAGAIEVASHLAGLLDLDPANYALTGFRLNAPRETTVRFRANGQVVAAAFDEPAVRRSEVPLFAILDTDAMLLFEDGAAFKIAEDRGDGTGVGSTSSGTILSPMPGRIIAVDVAHGQAVTKGQKLLTLEAMKMEHSLAAPFDGTIAELTATAGAQVQVDTLLVRVEALPA